MFNHSLADKDNIFIEYEDVIRCPSLSVLNFIISFKDYYKEFFNVDYLESLDDKNKIRLCVQRTDRNLFKYLDSKGNFPSEETLATIYDNDATVFFKAQVLDIVPSMIHYLSEPNSGDLYIYYPVNDIRVKKDIEALFARNPKVHFVYGNIFECQEVLEKCNLFIVSSVNIINGMLESEYGDGREYLLTNFGYNLKIDYENNKVETIFDYDGYLDKEKIFKFGTLNPISMDQSYFN